MSAWETSSGRPTDYVGTVDEMLFGFDSRIKGGEEIIAIFKIKPDDDQEVDTDDEGYVVENYTMGRNWKSLDGGETVTGNKKFNKQSAYGRLIDHVIVQLGSIDAASKFFDGDPTEAKIWLGMHAEFKEVDYPYPDKDNPGEMKHYLINMPFDITKPGQAKGSGTAAKKASGAAAKKATGNGAVDVEANLIKLAAALDYEDWVEQAMKALEKAGQGDNDEWVAKIGDSDYYESIKG